MLVDLGELGVADRWWDLAIATWSTAWDFGPELEAVFLEAPHGPPERPGHRPAQDSTAEAGVT